MTPKMTPQRSATVEIDDTAELRLKVPVKHHNETEDEKVARRKAERKRYRQLKLKGQPPPVTKKFKKQFNSIWDTETKFLTGVLQVLPEVRNPHLHDMEDEKMEDYLEEDEGAKKTQEKRDKFLAKMKQLANAKSKSAVPTRALSHEELKERLHAKLDSIGQKRNDRKRLSKLKKKELKKQSEEGLDKKKKFISKANPNLKNQKGQTSGSTLKDEKPSIDDNSTTQVKTPLRKKPVVKTNGEIVYSKFDFISEDKRREGGLLEGKTKGSGKPSAETLLKNAQKAESRVARLETQGKTSEAVTVVETQKWDSALKRAQGEKIRDDPALLKKTIKKQEKRKQVSKKKWQERTDNVQKQKDAKQEKRKSNMQAKKDDKIKKVKKQQRKKGRLA